MTAIWIGGYVLAALISVPFLARAFHEPDSLLGGREAAVGFAIVNAVFWPIWAGIGVVVLASKLLTPMIFPDKAGGDRG